MHETQVQTTVTEMALTPEIIVAEQRKDAALKPIIEALLKSDARPPWRSVQSESEETRALWAQFPSLKIKNNLLQRQFYLPDGNVRHLQVVMPFSLRHEVFT
jgi:hypothetical protein